MAKPIALTVLLNRRWAIPIVAELHRRQGERFAVLAHRFAISRETLSQTLNYLILHGLVRRNPGYGHPLRPEYLLTHIGEAIGPQCARLDDRLSKRGHRDLGLRKWTMPLVYALAINGAPARFSEILNTLGRLTPRALSDTLKRMERASLIEREIMSDFPPSTRYSLTASGKGYVPILDRIVEQLH